MKPGKTDLRLGNVMLKNKPIGSGGDEIRPPIRKRYVVISMSLHLHLEVRIDSPERGKKPPANVGQASEVILKTGKLTSSPAVWS